MALEASGVRFSYPDGLGVLRGMNLQVAAGERVGLIGPNGAGKTTFFLTACGILQPDAGTVRLFGDSIRPKSFHPDIGLVFQDPDDQLFSPSVWNDVAFGPQNMGLPPEEVAARVSEALTLTDTHELADRAPHHLSGGEKRMVSIAGVLAMQPRVIIYDEPSASLDIRSRRRLIRFLNSAAQALLIASHDLEFVLEVCDRVVVINDGQVIVGGEPRTIMRQANLMEENGLETPRSLEAPAQQRRMAPDEET
ncbi:energy-coupling factor ABC transporter ATP-binding protein [Allosalinactinospora lopnorensis]|uniref:energy-coupling factor ABC transporter ATP-binding protein n=1 Tax=Allosalinactinospora lopnorensis TaxID=1352348 RepID=UPI001F3867DE|nr:ABC transporter ATP-binding protein [Allosalinactinospora lopnorensis]